MSNAAEKASEAAEAKVEAEAAVAEEIAAVADIAAVEIERSQERAEQAEAVAQSIMDAAVFTELGKRVEALNQEVISCRGENQELRLKLSSLEATLADLSAKLPPNLIAPMADLPPPSKGSPIPPASEKTEVILASNPLDGEGDGQKGAETKAQKRKRFAL
jgi:hypothetical protein